MSAKRRLSGWEIRRRRSTSSLYRVLRVLNESSDNRIESFRADHVNLFILSPPGRRKAEDEVPRFQRSGEDINQVYI